MFQLKTAFELYHTYEAKIAGCDQELERELERLPNQVDLQAKPIAAPVGPQKMDEEKSDPLAPQDN